MWHPASLTCLFTGEGKDDDVIKRPGIVRVWWVEGQASGCSLAQVNEEGGVHHGNCKAAPALSLSDGDVGRGALVVALQEDGEVWSGGTGAHSRKCEIFRGKNGLYTVMPASSYSGHPRAM